MYCLRINGYWTTATWCLPNCSWQIYHIISYQSWICFRWGLEDDSVKVETCHLVYILYTVYEINCCVIDWHFCVFYICQNTSEWQTLNLEFVHYVTDRTICFLFFFFSKQWKVTISFVVSVCPSARNNSTPTWRIFVKFYIWVFFENLSIKFKSHCNLTTITGTSHAADRYTVAITSRSVVNMFQTSVVEKIKRHFVFSKFIPENSSIYEIMYTKYCRARQDTTTIWRMRIACWIPKATNTYSEYAILVAVPQQH
jgi:hypothetical protein